MFHELDDPRELEIYTTNRSICLFWRLRFRTKGLFLDIKSMSYLESKPAASIGKSSFSCCNSNVSVSFH